HAAAEFLLLFIASKTKSYFRYRFKRYLFYLYRPNNCCLKGSYPIISRPLYITRYTYKGAAEQKARSTYEYLIDLAEDPAVLAPLRFLREREIVHFQRFGECLDYARDYLNQQHYFFMQKNGCNTK
ncbi:MAG: manganese catalase family protein, partial [Anaerotignum sp.]|nr:manganese catalase family protein [Anaerotignum sp.]